MYRNVSYDYQKSLMWLSTWNAAGERVFTTEEFKPYLYVKDDTGTDAVSIYEEPLRKIEFNTNKKRREYSEANLHTYGNFPPEQQYLIDKYHGLEQRDDFATHPLKIFYLDIEVYAPEGFPSPLLAKDPIVVITVYDSLSGQYHTFGTDMNYVPKDPDVKYHAYRDEFDMVKAFIRWWRQDFPDMVTGWYSYGFDMPYLCNRINRLYNDPEAANRLSPVGRAWHKEEVKKRFGAVERMYDQMWWIAGVSHIDMQAAYFKFSNTKLESYSLNSVCDIEINEQKGEHIGSLSEWWIVNPREFIDYNIQDVRLLVHLEQKLQFMSLCRSVAHSGLVSMENALGTLSVVGGLVALQAIAEDRIVSTFDNSDAVVNYEGGFVSDPKVGFARDLVSIDANSMYPNCIITLNISNETKVGTVKKDLEGNYSLSLITGQQKTVTKEKFIQFLDALDIAISPIGVLFTQKKVGIFPKMIDRLYATRVLTKQEMFAQEKKLAELKQNHPEMKAEQQALSKRIEFLNLRQWLMKINLNSIYGAMGEKHFILFDVDLASSVSAMGRDCIQAAAKFVDEGASEIIGRPVEVGVYTDTDSRYFSITELLADVNEPFMLSENVVNPKVHEIADKIATGVNDKMVALLRDKYRSKNCTLKFKIEKLAPSGVWLAKKHYVVHVKNDEGIPVNKFSYTGIEVVKSSTPRILRPMIKKIIETLIKTQDRQVVNKAFKQAWEEYQKIPMESKVVSVGVNNLAKYGNNFVNTQELDVGTGTPRHVACALRYNEMLRQDGLDNVHETIKEGDKIKIMYVKPSVGYAFDSFGYKGHFPVEYKDKFVFDDKKMFEKTVTSCVQKVFKSIGWTIPDPTSEEAVDLMDLLGVRFV